MSGSSGGQTQSLASLALLHSYCQPVRGKGWRVDRVGSRPQAFLDRHRCSSEELLDRLFKKSVVTEAEVT